MDMRWSAADQQFREDVREFIAAELTPELRKAGRSLTSVYADYSVGMKWQRILHRRGWAAPAWPGEYGGCRCGGPPPCSFAHSKPSPAEPRRPPPGRAGGCAALSPPLTAHVARPPTSR